MGLFSSSSKTYVSTVTYPMGSDDPDDRVDYAKYVVLNAILQNKNITESLTRSIQQSRGMQLRRAYAYARDYYYYGLPYSGTLFIQTPDQEAIRAVLSALYTPADIYVLTSSVTLTDFTYWAEEYLTRTYGYDRLLGMLLAPPQGVEADAAISYDITTGGIIQILLVNEDGETHLIQYKPMNMASQKIYLHAIYRLITAFPTSTKTESHPTVEGEVNTVSTTVSIVDLVGESQEKTTVVTTTVDSGTTTVVTVEQVRVLSRPQYFFYQLGAGNFPVFDAWLSGQIIDLEEEPDPDHLVGSPYFPSLPLRIDNKDVSTTSQAKATELYKTSKKLLDKVGVNFDEIAAKINQNPQVSEIDFAYVQFGVALNTKTPECKQYIFKFMEMLQDLTFTSKAQMDAWVDQHQETLNEMVDDGLVDEEGGKGGPGGKVPVNGSGSYKGFTSPPLNKLQIYDRESRTKKTALDIELQWQYIDKTVKAGVVVLGAKIGDCTVQMTGSRTEYKVMFDFVVDNSIFVVRRQLTENTYEEISVGGLVYINHVYKDKIVAISAWDALMTADEEGFILPLNQDVLKDMSLLQVTQLSSDCLFVTLNCYKVVKKKWYQKGFFAVLMVIVAIVLLVVSWGASAPVSGSMIGMAIGALVAVGISVTIAMIIVATLTILVGMIISMLLTPVLSDVFGTTWGPVIATIVSALAMNWAATGNLAASSAQFTQLSAANIIRGSMAVVDAYGRRLQGEVLDTYGEIKELQSEEQLRMEEIERLTKENLGTHLDIIDLPGYINSTALRFESAGDFLTRTLMTGSDVANITRGLIEDFVEVGLYLPTNA